MYEPDPKNQRLSIDFERFISPRYFSFPFAVSKLDCISAQALMLIHSSSILVQKQQEFSSSNCGTKDFHWQLLYPDFKCRVSVTSSAASVTP